MTDDMVEWVARAIDPNAWDDLVKIFGLPGRARRQELSLISARAAIEAMREPTYRMIGTALDDYERRKGKQTLYDQYRAMIDAALASTHTEGEAA